jgi:cytochrome c oxidase subunit III
MAEANAMTEAAQSAAGDRARLGIWVFLASEIMFFGPLFFAYAVGRHNLRDAFLQAGASTDLLSGTMNTAILLSSSFTVALALRLLERDARRAACAALDATLVLAILFLAVKGNEYAGDWQRHVVPGQGFRWGDSVLEPGAELFYFVYFVTTLLHSLHVLIGIVLVGFSRLRLGRQAPLAERRRLEVVALYWHFVDIVWIFLFPALYLMGRAP